MNLKGKRVLITGGSSGIGLATAQAMLEAGARAFVTGRRPDFVAAAVDQLRAPWRRRLRRRRRCRDRRRT